ncbi:MAG: tryptophan synthase subunit alpha [Deltaproteobacteria bacterium]|nr:tryptophan synthase subunit alpha [Deltaproteobacteria bacterium]
MLESYLKNRLKQKDILLMTHIVLGYPSFEDCFAIIETMVRSGVDMMELQIPFSEPIADGPVILKANQTALKQGVTVQQCLDFAGEVSRTFDIPFLVMSYYNIPFCYGVKRFAGEIKRIGLKGAIIPDIPPEEGKDYLNTMKKHELAPILLFAPTTSAERMRFLASFAEGFIYCVARKGVTGAQTRFSQDMDIYLDRCRRATSLPLAVGFGIKEKADIDFLTGKADVAVIGSQTLRIIEKEGVKAVGDFISTLLR